MDTRRTLRLLGSNHLCQYGSDPARPLDPEADLSQLLLEVLIRGKSLYCTGEERLLGVWKLAVQLGMTSLLGGLHLINYREPWREPTVAPGYHLIEPVAASYEAWMEGYLGGLDENSTILRTAVGGYSPATETYTPPDTVRGVELTVSLWADPDVTGGMRARAGEILGRDSHQCIICLEECRPLFVSCCGATYCEQCTVKIDRCAHCRSETITSCNLDDLNHSIRPPLGRSVGSATVELVQQIKQSVPDAAVMIVCESVTSDLYLYTLRDCYIRTVDGTSYNPEEHRYPEIPHPVTHLIFSGALTLEEYDTWLGQITPVCLELPRVYWITPVTRRIDAPVLDEDCDHSVGEVQKGKSLAEIKLAMRTMVPNGIPSPELVLRMAETAVNMLQEREIAFQLQHCIAVSLQTSLGRGAVEYVRVLVADRYLDPIQILIEGGTIPANTRVRQSLPGVSYTLHPLQTVGIATDRTEGRLRYPEVRQDPGLLYSLLADSFLWSERNTELD